MTTELTSKDSVSTPRTAAEAGLRRLRQGFIYDKFGIKTKFQAQVLTRPISTTGHERSAATLQHAKFMFKARILGNPSPHDYLPDPCDASLALKQKEALKLINFHTTFISNTDFARDIQNPPKIGDLVDVKLEPGNYSYDLQTGTYIGTINVNNAMVRDPTTEATAKLIACESLTDLFGEGNVPVMVDRRRSRVVVGGPSTDAGSEARVPLRSEIDYGPGSHAPRRLEQFDKEFNLWRCAQPDAKELAWLIDTYKIKYVVRMNENEGGMVMADEKGVCDAKSCVYNPGQPGTPTYINAHSGYKRFEGYTSSKREVFQIFEKKDVLVHCSAGKDRTGYIVAAWIDKRAREGAGTLDTSNFPDKVSAAINETDNTKRREVLWKYTIAFNKWGGDSGRVCTAYAYRKKDDGSTVKYTNWGYGAYLDGFYPLDDWCKSKIGELPTDRAKCRICQNLDQYQDGNKP